jgi:hypothetical protein
MLGRHPLTTPLLAAALCGLVLQAHDVAVEQSGGCFGDAFCPVRVLDGPVLAVPAYVATWAVAAVASERAAHRRR